MAAESMQNLLKIGALTSASIPASARRMARCSLFDWMVVARAGQDQPLAGIIRDYVTEDGGKPVASVIGGGKVPARGAALVNGTISHALDYDDTHFGHVGHPSVGIMPAALAAAEEVDAPGAAVADAFLLGAEASVRLGMVLGRAHYQRGFHQTATAGAFGATLAAGWIYGLDAAQLRNALSLAATRASGLKSQFGTMGKPFNAGIAAANGIEAAGLAKRGFVSCDDGVAGPQGFVETHSDAPEPVAPWQDPPPQTFLFEDVKYKLHACCHGTHAMIEALATAKHDLAADQVAMLSLRVNPRWLKVCDIKAPRTGLEVKFSYAWLAGMVFNGIDTASDAAYVDALGTDSRLANFAGRVRVSGDDRISDTATKGELTLNSGEIRPIAFDLADRLAPAVIESGLRAKAKALIGAEAAEQYWEAVVGLEHRRARDLGALLRAT